MIDFVDQFLPFTLISPRVIVLCSPGAPASSHVVFQARYTEFKGCLFGWLLIQVSFLGQVLLTRRTHAAASLTRAHFTSVRSVFP